MQYATLNCNNVHRDRAEGLARCRCRRIAAPSVCDVSLPCRRPRRRSRSLFAASERARAASERARAFATACAEAELTDTVLVSSVLVAAKRASTVAAACA